MTDEKNFIKSGNALVGITLKQGECKEILKRHNNSLTFSVWTMAGTVLAACTSPIFSDIADLAGGGGGGDTQSGATVPARTFDGPVDGARFFIDNDDDGIYTEGPDTDLGTTNGVGRAEIAPPQIGAVVYADVNGALDIATGEILSGVWQSLPYDGSGQVLISPLTDLLSRQLMEPTNTDDVTDMGQDAFLQDVLDYILGDSLGDALGDAAEITVADVLNHENYNPVGLADASLERQIITTAAIELTVIYENPANLADSAAARDALKTAVGSFTINTDTMTVSSATAEVQNRLGDAQDRGDFPVVAEVNGGESINTQEEVDISVADLLSGSSAERLFGFEDTLAPENDKDSLVGIYIQAQSITSGITVMFGQGSLSDSSDTARGVPAGVDAMRAFNSGQDVFYFVHVDNLEQLIFRPNSDFTTDPDDPNDPATNAQIRFYVYDGEHATAIVENAGELLGVGELEITVANVNDVPVVTPPANPAPITGNTGSASGTFQVSDADGDTDFKWSATPTSTPTGISYGEFRFTNSQGAWEFILNAQAFDALAAGVNVSLTFDITAEDDNGGVSDAVTLTIMLQGQNDAPSDITTGGAALAVSYDDVDGIPNNGIFIATLSTVDADTGDTHTYTIDEAMLEGEFFSIRDGNGAVSPEGTHLWLDNDADARVVGGTWEVVVTSMDDASEATSKTFSIMRTDAEANLAPTLTQPTAPPAGGYFVEEDSSTSMVSGTLMVADANVADTPASLTVIGVINGGANTLNTQPDSGMISSDADIYAITGSDQRLAGEYGDFILTRSANGQIAWRYEIDEARANSLDENATPTETLLLRVWDDEGLASTNTQTISVEVRGADDAITITSPASDFGPFEVVDTSITDTDDAPTATGTFSASDPDDDITWSATATGANGGLGTVAFIGNDWTFTLTDLAGVRALNALAPDATTDITFDITANGMDAGRNLTITLRGAAGEANLAPTLTPSAPPPAGGYFVAEDSSTSMVNGTLTVADANVADTVASLTVIGVINGQANALNTQPDADTIRDDDDIYAITGSDQRLAGEYGDFILTRSANGRIEWRYEIDEARANSLDETETPTETLSLRVWDDDGLASSIRTISVEVRGADDAITINSPASDFGPFEVVDTSITNDNDAPTTTGTFSASDPDDDITWSATATGANSGLGTVTFIGNAWTFELTSGPGGGVATLNALAPGATTDITFDITANGMDAGRYLTITLRGAVEEINVAPTLTLTQPTAPPAGGYFVAEDSSTSMVNGTLMVADTNVADTPASLTVIGVINGGANALNTQPASGMISSNDDIYVITGSDQRLAGEYGNFFLTRSANGQIAWRYEIDEARTNSLDETEAPTETLLLRVWDDDGLASTNTQTISVEVRGADDAATITSPASDFGPFEVVDPSRTITDSAPTATGTFSASDPDDSTITWLATPIGANSGLGTVTFIGNAWEFTLTSTGIRALNDLVSGATTDITFDITANGVNAGTPLTITLKGAAGEINVAPTLTTPAGGYFVVEDSSTSMVNDTLTVADTNVADTVATLTVIGVINGQTNTLNTQPDAGMISSDADIYAITGSNLEIAGQYGKFVLTLDNTNGRIEWRYEIDEVLANSLDENATPTETLSLRAWDDDGLASSIQTISVEVRGANDPLEFDTNNRFAPFEVVDPSRTVTTDAPTTTGTFSASDPDDAIIWLATPTGANSGLGTVTFSGNAWTFELTSGPAGGVATLNGLASGQEREITFDISANGVNAGTQLTITLKGAVEEVNVAPTLTTPAGGYFVVEDSSTSMVNDTLTVADTNVADTVASLTVIGVINGQANTLNTQPDPSSDADIYAITGSNLEIAGRYGKFVLTLDNTNGRIEWRYEIDQALANSLDENATPTERLLLRAWDDDGLESSIQTISVEVRGADDAPVFDANNRFSPFEVVDPSRTVTNDAPTATGTFSATDPDDSTITWLATPTGANSGLGMVTFSGNAWRFELTSGPGGGVATLNGLASGQEREITFTITANGVDAGTPLTITLKGAAEEPNVAPTLTTPAGGYFVEEDSSTSMVSDTLTVADSNMADTVASLTVIGVINGQANALDTQPDPSIDGDDIYAITGSNLDIAGQYGKFVLTRDNNNGQIAWRYEIDEALANSLDENATPTETLLLRVWDDDGLESSIRTISVEVRGADDATMITSTSDSGDFGPITVTDPSRTNTGDAPTATGTFSATDPDDSTIRWSATPTGANSGLGTVTFIGNTWTFELTDPDGIRALNDLVSGDTRPITFDISANGVDAGTPLTITLQGVALPVLGEEANAEKTATEAGHELNNGMTVAAPSIAAMGSFTHTDANAGQGGFVGGTVHIKADGVGDDDTVAANAAYAAGLGRDDVGNLVTDGTDRGTAVVGTYGTIYLRAGGDWYYVLDDARTDINALPDGASALEDVFDVRIQETVDSTIVSNVLELRIAIAGKNDAPSSITASSTTTTYSGTAPPPGHIIATLTSTDPDSDSTGNTYTYAIDTSSADAPSFRIIGNQLQFALSGAVDRNAGDSWTVGVISTDNDGLSRTETFTIMRAGNAAPTDIITDVAGTSAALTATYDGDDVPIGGHLVATFSDSIDVNVDDTHRYSIVPSTVDDSGLFTIRGGNQLVLLAGSSPTLGDTLEVTVRTTDAGTGAGGLMFDKTFTITRAGNVSPTDITTTDALTVTYDGNDLPSDGRRVLTLGTTDLNASDSHTYSITGGMHASSFAISGNELRLATSGGVSVAPGETWQVTITTTDSGTGVGGLMFEEDFTITRAGNAFPEINTGTSGTAYDTANERFVADVTDPNRGDTASAPTATGMIVAEDFETAAAAITYSAARAQGETNNYGSITFDSNNPGAWTFTLTTPADVTGDFDGVTVLNALTSATDTAEMDFTVTADDGAGGTDTATLRITLRGAPAAIPPPAITSGDMAGTITDDDFRDHENIPASDSGTITATGSDIEWSSVITGISGLTGDLASRSAADFGSLTLTPSVNGNSVEWVFTPTALINELRAADTNVMITYTITARNGGGEVPTTLTINLDGANDAPVLTQAEHAPPGVIIDKSVMEAGGSNNDVAGDTMARGSLINTDIDMGQSGFGAGRGNTVQGAAGTSPTDADFNALGNDDAEGGKGTRITGVYGDLFLKNDGTWTYELDDDRDATQSLNGPDTNISADRVQDVFTIRVQNVDDTDTKVSNEVEISIDVTGADDDLVLDDLGSLATIDGARVDEIIAELAGPNRGNAYIFGDDNDGVGPNVNQIFTARDPDSRDADLAWSVEALSLPSTADTVYVDLAEYGMFEVDEETGDWRFLFTSAGRRAFDEIDFTGTGEDEDNGLRVIPVRVTVTNDRGISVSDTFEITLEGRAEAPMIADENSNDFNVIFSTPPTSTLGGAIQAFDPDMPLDPQDPGLVWTHELTSGDGTLVNFQFMGELNQSTGFTEGKWTLTLTPAGETRLSQRGGDREDITYRITVTDNNGNTDTEDFTITLSPPSSDVPPATGLVDLLPGADVNLQFGYDHFGQGQFGFARGGGALPDASVFTDSGDDDVDIQIGGQLAEPFTNPNTGQFIVAEPIHLFTEYTAVEVPVFGIPSLDYDGVADSRTPVPFRYSTDNAGIVVFQNRSDVTYDILNPNTLVIPEADRTDFAAHRDKSSPFGELHLFPDGRWTYNLFTDPGRAGKNSGTDYYRITYRRIDSGVIQENDHDIGVEERTGLEISDTYILRINVAAPHALTFTNTINRFFNEKSEGIITGLFDDVDRVDIRQYGVGGLDAAREGSVAREYVDTTPRGDEVGIFEVDSATGVFTYNFTGGGRAAIEARLIHTDVGNDPIIKREIPVWGVDKSGNIGTTMVEVSISGLFRLQVQASSPDITSMPDRSEIYPNTLAIGDHRDNTLTLGTSLGRNFIFAHEGSDTINLAVDGPDRDSPEDVIYHRFSSAHDIWVNYDGADTINNFDRATDTFILVDRDTGSDVDEPEIFGSGTQLQIHAIFGNNGADKDSLAGFTLRFSNDANSVITFNYLTPRNVSNSAEAARFFGNGRASLDESDGNRITDHGLFEVYFGSARSFQVIEELPQYLNDYTDTDIIFRPIDDPADQADRFITGAGDGEILIGDSRDNTIRPAGGQDHIVGGRGDDEISLSFGDDSVYHRFSSDSANWINIDGSDHITGFRRREDAFIFLDIDTTSTVDEAAIKGVNTELQLFAILEDPATISGVYLVFENDLGGVVRIDYRQDERITITAGNEADFFGTSPNTTSLYNNDGEMLTIRRVTDLSGIGNFFGDSDDQFQVLSQLPRILADILPEISNIGDDIPMDSGTGAPGPAIQTFTLSPANEFTHDTLTHGELIFTAFRGGDTTPPTVDRPQVGIELTFGGVPGSGVNVTAIGTGGDVVTIDIVVATDLMDGAQAVTWQTIRDAVNTNGHTAQHVRVSYAAGADGTGAPDAFDTLYADRNGKLSGGEGLPSMPAMDAVALTPDTATFGDLTFTSMIEGDSRLHDVKQVRLIFTDSATGADPIVSVNDSSNSVTDITISVNRNLDATTWDEVLRAYNEHTASTAPNGVTTPAASRVAAITTSTGFDLSQSLGNYFAARPSVDNHFTQAGAAARLVLDGGAGATALVEAAPTFNMLAPRDWPFEFTSVKAGRTWRDTDAAPADFAPKIEVDLVFRGGNNRDPFIRSTLLEEENDAFNADPNKTRTTLKITVNVSDNMMNANGTPTTWRQINDLLVSDQYIGDDRNNIADGELFTFRVPDLNVLGEAIVSTDALDADLFGGAGREGVPAIVDVFEAGPLRFSSLSDGAEDSSGVRTGKSVRITVNQTLFTNEGNNNRTPQYNLLESNQLVDIEIDIADSFITTPWRTIADIFTNDPLNRGLSDHIKFEVIDPSKLDEGIDTALVRIINVTGGRLAEDAIPAVEHRDAVNAIEAMAATPAVRPTSAVGGQQEAEPETAERTIEDPFEDIEPISTVFVPDIPDM